MKISAMAFVAALLSLGSNALAAPHAVPLASVAHRLGLAYAYLGPDDVVSLTGNGLAVVVRPGAPYFTVNDRVEPVEGDAPRYQGGDLFVSPEFVRQLNTIEHAAASKDKASRSKMAAASTVQTNAALADVKPQRVLGISLTEVKGTSDVAVMGEATPGAVVAIVLKANEAPELPTIYLNRSFAVTASDGHFSIEIPTAPNYFSGSVLTAEASASDDVDPMTAHFTPPSR